jgi:CCR4-NOT transcription complex subunit 1
MFEEWARVSETPGRDDEMLMNWATQLTHAGMLKCDDTTERFLHILTELVVAHCLSSEAPAPAGGPHTLLNFAAIDAYARLVLLLVKFLKQERGGNDAAQHLVLFGQALDMTAAVLQVNIFGSPPISPLNDVKCSLHGGKCSLKGV